MLYSFYFKYFFEKFISKILPVKFYFKNLYKYIKSNLVFQKAFWLLRKKSFLKNMAKRYFSYLEMINVLLIGIISRNVELLTLYLTLAFEKSKKHFKIIKDFRILILDFFTKIPIFAGIKLKISGKFHGKTRSSSKVLYIYRNVLPILTFKSSILYNYREVNTFTGIFGIHLWLYYK